MTSTSSPAVQTIGMSAGQPAAATLPAGGQAAGLPPPAGAGVIISPACSPAVQTAVAAGQAASGQVAGAPQPAGTGVAETATVSDEEQKKEQFIAFKLIGYVLPFALANRPPELYSDLAIEQLQTRSDPGLVLLIEEIVSSTSFDPWFAELQTLEPRIGKHRRWLKCFLIRCVSRP
jgi:hypothetical protein